MSPRKQRTERCINCAWFKKMYYQDGMPAGAGRCVCPQRENTRHRITPGTYPHNICDHFKAEEDDSNKNGLTI